MNSRNYEQRMNLPMFSIIKIIKGRRWRNGIQ